MDRRELGRDELGLDPRRGYDSNLNPEPLDEKRAGTFRRPIGPDSDDYEPVSHSSTGRRPARMRRISVASVPR